VRKDGQLIPISVTVSPVKDEAGRVIGASKIARDITDRKLAEAAAAERNRLMALRADISTALASDGDQRAILRECTTSLVHHLEVALARIWTLNAAEGVLELKASEGLYTHLDGPHSRIKVGEFKIGRIASSRQPHVTNDVPHDPDVSDQAWARREGLSAFAGYPLAVEGRLLGVLGMFARRTLPDEVTTDLEPLANMIALYLDRRRVEEELRRVAAELSEADRRKNEFLATLAHELRNPLAPIRNGLQLMHLAGDDPQIIKESLPLMERQVQQMVRLIDDLMDVSRITLGKLELRKERVELASVIRHAVETSRPLIEESRHELAVTTSSMPIYVDADLTRLAQVFSNILNNAAKYTERGGEIALIVERNDNEAVVSVRDNGIGIPPEMLHKVFEPFTQVDRSLERSKSGLGIGLTLVKRLVEMHGGSIDARSGGQRMGSEFVVRLPIMLVMASEAVVGDVSPTMQSAGRRILVVDDNRDSAQTLARLLEIIGHEARTAHDGGEAVATAGAYHPEVIMLDIGLPVMNGYEVARTIRRHPWGTDIVIVALTGWGQMEDRKRSKEAGIDHHLVKPVEPQALIDLLSRMVQGPS
jgi:signal transduction histidine kinase/CheY-like chemotaxis protein